MPIARWRREIDETDAQILELLSRRARAVEKIGEEKAHSSRTAFVPTREKEIYARLAELNEGPLADEDVRSIFREIISVCRRLEEPMTVAFLGPEGTFTHVAAYDIFGHAATYVPGRTISSVFAAVETGRADCGVVPIENSSEGAVRETLDMFLTSELQVMSEEVLDIHLNLLGQDTGAEVRRVCSKPIALAQCRDWLAEHLPDTERVETASTAHAAREAAEDPHTAVVAHEMVARLYGLEVLQAHIEDVERNVTRFLVIGRARSGRTGNDKTSFLCSVKHEPGALWQLLNVIKNHGLNMTYLYPRPSRDKPWEYFFFVDLEGHREDPEVAAGLADAEKYCSFFKVLGSFPKAE
ncbi:MAG: prephenate dehydratase [Planctomycetota bacterium]